MNEEPSELPPGADPEPGAAFREPELLLEPPPLPPPPRRRRSIVPWVFLLLIIVLGGAGAFLWLNPTARFNPFLTAARVNALTERVAALEADTKQLAERPVGQPEALGALREQVAALATRTPAPAPDLSGIERRIEALERRPVVAPVVARPPVVAPAPVAARAPVVTPAPVVDLAPVQKELGELGSRMAALGRDHTGLDARVAALGQDRAGLEARVAALGRDRAGLDARVAALTAGTTSNAGLAGGLTSRLDAQGKTIEAMRADVGRLEAELGRANVTARAEAGLAALAEGRPVGIIAGAPEAVARFATAAPPTVAALRQSFPAVAEAALAASQPDDSNRPLVDRMWTRAQGLVTVRQGDRVLVGDPAEGVIARARAALDAGDLAGAIDALSTLKGPAGAAVADWVTSARALLAARAGLLVMVAGNG